MNIITSVPKGPHCVINYYTVPTTCKPVLNQCTIERVKETVFLGVISDETLSWKPRIANVVKNIKIYQHHLKQVLPLPPCVLSIVA